MPQRKLVLFDWDGTLSDVTKTLEYGLPRFSGLMGLPYNVRQFSVGYFHPETIDMGWGLPLSEQKNMRTQWDLFLTENTLVDDNFLPPLYAGVPEMLAQVLKIYDVGIVTARDREPLLRMMKFHCVDKHMIAYRTRDCAARDGYLVKPSPEALLSVIKETGHLAEDTVMIGDSSVDIEMANKAGIESIAVLWGLYPEESLEVMHPTLTVSAVDELPAAIERIFKT